MKTQPQMSCAYCPEMFIIQRDADLHVGIHSNPYSEKYSQWCKRLGEYKHKNKPAVQLTSKL